MNTAYGIESFTSSQSVIGWCIVLFMLGGSLFFSFIILSRIIKSRRHRLQRWLQDHIQKSLNAFIVHETEQSSGKSFPWRFHLRALRSLLTNAWRRQIMIDMLVANKQNLAGKSGDVLRKVYLRLGLRRVSRAKLTHTNPHIKISGLQELALMECADALTFIQTLLHHPNRQVREESFVALVRLVDVADSDLVLAYDDRISGWMRIILHQHLRHLGTQRLPHFAYWLKSHNPSVRKFAMEMIIAFRQLEAVPALIELLNDEDISIAALSATALGEMGISEAAGAVASLGAKYPAHEEVSMQVVHALRNMTTDDQYKAYLSWQLTHGAPVVRMEALRTLLAIGVDLLDTRLDFNTENDRDFDRLYAHVTHPLLA